MAHYHWCPKTQRWNSISPHPSLLRTSSTQTHKALLMQSPQWRRIWAQWGARICWEDRSPDEFSSSPAPPERDAWDGAPKSTLTCLCHLTISIWASSNTVCLCGDALECCTFSNWHGVCPKLLIMPSRAFLSFSSVMASRSTAPKTSTDSFITLKTTCTIDIRDDVQSARQYLKINPNRWYEMKCSLCEHKERSQKLAQLCMKLAYTA